MLVMEPMEPMETEPMAGSFVAHVRHLEGDAHLRLQLRLHGDAKSLVRPVGEKLDKIRVRLQLLAAKLPCAAIKKQAQSSKKKKKGNKQQQRSVMENVQAQKQVPVRFYTAQGDEIAGKSECIGDAFTRITRLTIGRDAYLVVRNHPLVLSISVVDPIIAGLPREPMAETEFCTPDECHWQWFRIDQHTGQEQLCATTRRFTPHEKDDVDRCFRIVCRAPAQDVDAIIDISESTACEIVTAPARAGPDRSVFRQRQTLAQQPRQPNSVRVMSYNVLFDGYVTTLHAQTNLFPYVKPEMLHEMYRMQLVFEELVESDSDVICLQEMGENVFRTFFEPMLRPLGFFGFYSNKTGTTREGCATFVRSSCFDVVEEQTLELSAAVKSSQDPVMQAVLAQFPEIAKGIEKIPSVAQLTLLRCKQDQSRLLLMANTHLFYREDSHLIRLLQTVAMMSGIESIQSRVQEQQHSSVSVVLCGDFNAFPGTAPIKYLLDGGIDSSHEHWQQATSFKWSRSAVSTGSPTKKPQAVLRGSFVHHLKLRSAYGIPEFTNFAGTFVGTLDYILVDARRLKVQRVFPLFSREDVSREVALPSSMFPSDHISLICDLEWL